MPTKVIRRKREVTLARVQIDRKVYQKTFPGHGRQAWRDAVSWENENKKKLQQFGPTGLKLCEWEDLYLRHSEAEHVSKHFDGHRRSFRYASEYLDMTKEVRAIDEPAAKRLLDDIAREKGSGVSNRTRKSLHTAWKYGCQYIEYFPKDIGNPFANIPHYKTEQQLRYVPGVSDFWRVVNAADDFQDRVLLLTFLFTAGRRGEIFGLQWEDIDFRRNMIRLWTRKRDRGREYDLLPLVGELKRELLAHWENRAFPNQPYVFVVTKALRTIPREKSRIGQPFVSRQKFLESLCKRAKVKPFGYHAIRHLTASMLWQNGETLDTIQSVLRHKAATTTNRYIRSLGLESARRGLEGLGESRGELFPL